MTPENELPMDQVFLQRLTQVVLDNLENEQFGVEELADKTGISRSQLHRKLKLLKGKSVSQFIREVRLEEAMKLLENDVATASEIAYRVGFSSPSYFNKCFQQYYGIPPGEVRQKNRRSMSGEQSEYRPVEAIQHEDTETKKEKSKTKSLLRVTAALILIFFAALSVRYLVTGLSEPIPDRSIAVLPFTNLSNNPENQYFADGIVEDLLNRLSRIESFKVISRTSSEMYREKGQKSLPQIAGELGVSYILEGSIQRDADKARVNVQLIDARSDNHIWSRMFDRDLSDIFKTQSEIAVQIAGELNTVLTAKQTSDVQRNLTTNVKALEYYQLGRFHWNKRTGDGYRTSIDYFKKAIELDTQYALAYAGLADSYNLMALQGHIDEAEGRDFAVNLAKKALEMDNSLAMAHNVLASIYTYLDLNWDDAEKEYRLAIEKNPNYSTAHHYYSEHLSFLGKHDEARRQINKALELDPLSFIIHYVSAKLYYNRGMFEEALAENKRCHELQRDHRWSVWYDFEINYRLGRDKEALAGFKRFGELAGAYDPAKADSIYFSSGLNGLVRYRIEHTTWNYGKAELYGLMGEYDKAMNWLEEAFEKKTFNPEFVFYINFDGLHANPRFMALIAEMGLPDDIY